MLSGDESVLAPLLGVVVALLLFSAAAWLTVRYIRRGGHWQLVDVKGDFTAEHHLPDRVPVPQAHVDRVRRGEFTLDEVVAWMTEFTRQRKRHPLRPEFQRVIRKYDLYRELGQKMGRGQWRDVDQLGKKLAEIDPLDPSAALARGRAMRELGHFPHAIRHYQRALDLTPFHSSAFPEMAATCRAIGQPGRFRAALDRAKQELGDTHPLTLEGRIQLGELVRVYADPTDPATLAHIPREQYLQNLRHTLEEMSMDAAACLQVGQAMLSDDMPELADFLAHRCERDYGNCAEALLLAGLLEHYRLNYELAEQLIRSAIEREDSSVARMELARLLLARAELLEKPKALPLRTEADQQLRLAIDRDPNLTDAIVMLVEPGWAHGIEQVRTRVGELIEAYPHSWGTWRVLGDAYVSESKSKQAVESYLKGIAISYRDELLLPCLNAMEDAALDKQMLELIRTVDGLEKRDPQLRWRAAHVFCDHRMYNRARKLLQSLVDDEQVPPQLRQRADDVLDHLDDMERKKPRAPGTRKPPQRD